jgi:peptidoglycan/LPS O-acetylase OafA/YrhL
VGLGGSVEWKWIVRDEGFLPRVESLRGIAAVLVGAYHVGQALLPAPPTGLGRLYMGFCNGIGCVVAFFVISGFVLARSLDRKIASSAVWAPRYFTARGFRLYPAAVVAVALFVLVRYQFGIAIYDWANEPLNVLLNMMLVHTDIDRVMWSMKIELVATPLIPLAVMAFHRWGARPLLIAIFVLFGFSFFGQYCELLGAGSNLGPLYAFLFGILLHFRGERIAAWIGPGRAPWVALAAVGTFVLCGALKATAIQVMVECASATTLIMMVVWQPASVIFKPLDSAIVRFYGRISYSFYLLHPLTLWAPRVALVGAVDTAVHAGIPLVIVTMAVASFTILLTTPAAYLSWRFVEMPGVALGRAIADRRIKSFASAE